MSDLGYLGPDDAGFEATPTMCRRHTPGAPSPIIGASGLTPTERKARDRAKHRAPRIELGEDWKQDGACRTSTLDFFPDRNEDTSRQKQLCSGCPVRETCLEYALIRHEHGFWGGTTWREREDIRRNQRQSA